MSPSPFGLPLLFGCPGVLASRLLYASADDDFGNRTTVDYFTKVHNVSQSSRAIGWDTNNYEINTIRSAPECLRVVRERGWRWSLPVHDLGPATLGVVSSA